MFALKLIMSAMIIAAASELAKRSTAFGAACSVTAAGYAAYAAAMRRSGVPL